MLSLKILKSSLVKPFKLFSKILSSAVILLIDLYRLTFSGLAPACRFTPTCSQFSREAFLKFGFLKGSLMTLQRLSRCHPWGGSGYDPVAHHHCPLTGRNH